MKIGSMKEKNNALDGGGERADDDRLVQVAGLVPLVWRADNGESVYMCGQLESRIECVVRDRARSAFLPGTRCRS